MALPIRETLVVILAQAFQGISIANGYSRNVNQVIRFPEELPQTPSFPVIYFAEGDEKEDTGDAIGKSKMSLEIVAVMFDMVHHNHMTEVNKMIADLKLAAGSNYCTIMVADQNGVEQKAVIWPVGNIYEIEKSTGLVKVGVEFLVTYRHDVGNPYIA